MKLNLSTPAQKWRLAVLILLLLTFTSTLIPGSYTWCNYHPVTHPDHTTHHFDNYIRNPAILGTQGIMVLILTAIALSIFSIRKNRCWFLLFDALLCGLSIYISFYCTVFHFALKCIRYNHGFMWFPFVPPILMAVSMIAAVVAWFVGLIESRKG